VIQLVASTGHTYMMPPRVCYVKGPRSVCKSEVRRTRSLSFYYILKVIYTYLPLHYPANLSSTSSPPYSLPFMYESDSDSTEDGSLDYKPSLGARSRKTGHSPQKQGGYRIKGVLKVPRPTTYTTQAIYGAFCISMA
jgi:hypothetical protein